MLFLGSDNTLASKIRAIVASHDLFCINLPHDKDGITEALHENSQELVERKQVLETTMIEIEKTVRNQFEINDVTNVSLIEETLLILHREKEIAKSMAYLEPSGANLLKGYLWTPVRNDEKLDQNLENLVSENENFTKPLLKKVNMDPEMDKWKRPTSF